MGFENKFNKGELIYNVIEGWSSKNKANLDNIIDEEREIKIGEKMEFVGLYSNEMDAGKPYEWQIMFKCKDGYVSNSGCFGIVTQKEWENLKDYFRKYYE